VGARAPHDVHHHGLAVERVAARVRVLAAAHAAHPERFSAGVPVPPPLPTAVWTNPPTLTSSDVEEARVGEHVNSRRARARARPRSEVGEGAKQIIWYLANSYGKS